MATVDLSSLSTEFVKARVRATEEGEPVDPTGNTVEMAFTSIGSSPSEDDWHDAEWETDATTSPPRYYARCLVGPDNGVELAPGTYKVWVKVNGPAPETPVIDADDTLVIT